MKQLLRIIRRPLVCVFVSLIYLWGCLWYDKAYLTGRYFDRRHYTKGWKWILQYWFGQKVMGEKPARSLAGTASHLYCRAGEYCVRS